jgi:hypothetical protein
VNPNAREITEAGLAFLTVGGVVGIAIYDAINGRPVTVPPELYGFAGIVLGAYFRGSAAVNGMATTLANKVVASLNASPPAAPTPPVVP